MLNQNQSSKFSVFILLNVILLFNLAFHSAAPDSPAQPLSPEGPWLLLVSNEGLHACNQDGSGLTLLTDADTFGVLDVTLNAGAPRQLNIATAPSGGRAALVAIENTTTLHGLALHMLTLPDGTIELITPLVAPEIEAADQRLGSDREDFARKVLIGSPQWSPDGQRLAFLAALESPVFDLYVYDAETEIMQRLTMGQSSPSGFSWSMDGRYLVFWGANWLEPLLSGLGVVDAQGNSAPTVYQDLFPQAEGSFIGWINPQTYLIHSWNIAKGNHDLRQFNILTGDSLAVWRDVFTSVARDPQSNRMGLCLTPDEAEFHGQTNAGVYLIDPDDLKLQKIVDSCQWIEWWQSLGSFIFADEYLFQLMLDGELVMLEEDMSPAELSPDGQWMYRMNAIDGFPGLQIASIDGEWVDVYAGLIDTIKWRPDGEGLYFLDNQGALFSATLPDFDPIELGQGVYFIDWLNVR